MKWDVPWSTAQREEHRVRMFENGVLREILGPERDEVTMGLEDIALWGAEGDTGT